MKTIWLVSTRHKSSLKVISKQTVIWIITKTNSQIIKPKIDSQSRDNTRIYTLISVPQITRFLLEDAIILSKTNPCSGSAKQKRSNGEVNEAVLATFSFISKLYLKQQANIFWCFFSSKFENSLFGNKLFRCIFRSERKVYTAEKRPNKVFCSKLAC